MRRRACANASSSRAAPREDERGDQQHAENVETNATDHCSRMATPKPGTSSPRRGSRCRPRAAPCRSGTRPAPSPSRSARAGPARRPGRWPRSTGRARRSPPPATKMLQRAPLAASAHEGGQEHEPEVDRPAPGRGHQQHAEGQPVRGPDEERQALVQRQVVAHAARARKRPRTRRRRRRPSGEGRRAGAATVGARWRSSSLIESLGILRPPGKMPS